MNHTARFPEVPASYRPRYLLLAELLPFDSYSVNADPMIER
jgi:hypothetical protein